MNVLDWSDQELVDFLGMQEQQYLEKPEKYLDQIEERIAGNHELIGEKLPWKKTWQNVRARPGEVSLVAGINGHGKSLVLGQILSWMQPSQKIIIASLEMAPAATLARMCKQTITSGAPSRQYIEMCVKAMDNFWLYDQTDTLPPNRILAMCHWAGKTFGVNHIMIDSLVKCGIKQDDLDGQKNFVDRLCWCARLHDIHIWLVHHVRKAHREGEMPDKLDIKGAGEITDLVDNVFIMHRNKDKERKIESRKSVDELEPDGVLMCSKQRHGEWEGAINLYFHKTSTQFMGAPDRPLRWRIE